MHAANLYESNNFLFSDNGKKCKPKLSLRAVRKARDFFGLEESNIETLAPKSLHTYQSSIHLDAFNDFLRLLNVRPSHSPIDDGLYHYLTDLNTGKQYEYLVFTGRTYDFYPVLDTTICDYETDEYMSTEGESIDKQNKDDCGLSVGANLYEGMIDKLIVVEES